MAYCKLERKAQISMCKCIIIFFIITGHKGMVYPKMKTVIICDQLISKSFQPRMPLRIIKK